MKQNAPCHHTALLCLWQWYTVGFLRATGGWVSTQSELYIKPIGLIYSPNNSRLIKKEKGEEAYKIKKRLKVPQWQRERDRENCMWVHVGAVGLHEPDIVYGCKLLWGLRSKLTVATTERAVTAPFVRSAAPSWWSACCRADWPNMLWRGPAIRWGLRQMSQSRSFN